MMMIFLLSTIYSCLLLFVNNVQGEFINFVENSFIDFFAPFCPPRNLSNTTSGIKDSGIRWEDDSGSGVHYINIADATHGLVYQLGRDDDFINNYIGFIEGTADYPTSLGPVVPIFENVTGYPGIGDGVTDKVLVEVLEQLPGTSSITYS